MTSRGSPAMIEVADVAKSFGTHKVLDAIRFTVRQGEPVTILGPSGSGKTTLLRIIAGLEMPDEGEILINGRLASRPGRCCPPHSRGIGFVFQSPALWPHLTIAQNIRFGIRNLTRDQTRARVNELLEQTSLTGLGSRYPHQISGGESRRVALARALAGRPRYLLMDEPLTNLDSELKSTMIALIKELLRQPETTLVYVTHDRAEAQQLCGRLLYLKDCKLIEDR